MNVKKYVKKIVNNIIEPTIVQNKFYPQICITQSSQILKNRTALITGGTSGIGYAIAKSFLLSGASVVITGRKYEKITIVCEKLKTETGLDNVYGYELNNENVSIFDNAYTDILSIVPGNTIDILVNNAGVIGSDFRWVTPDEFDRTLNINLKAPYFLSRLFVNDLLSKNKEGNILNIVSSSGIRPATSPYMLSKWGLRGLTEGLGRLLAPQGIIVNGIAPGPTATPMQPLQEDNDISWPKNLAKRMTTPEEIASMATMLVSSSCRTIIGDIIYMSGGGGNITNEDVTYNY